MTNLVTLTKVDGVTAILLMLVVVTAARGAQSSGIGSGSRGGETSEEEIQRVLKAQVAAWNRGNLDGFMSTYWKSPELTFFSNDRETRGWQPTLDRYKNRYQSKGQAMGQLDFPALQVTLLSNDVALVRGQFHLKMPDGKEPHGMFTLVLRRFPREGWKIVHDHSSGE